MNTQVSGQHPTPCTPIWQAANELGDDIGVNSLSSRLVLLALHFPRLRLIWSRSLHATAAIFRDLKANMDEPDPVRAAAIGAPSVSLKPQTPNAVSDLRLSLLEARSWTSPILCGPPPSVRASDSDYDADAEADAAKSRRPTSKGIAQAAATAAHPLAVS